MTTTEGIDYAKTLVYRGRESHIEPFSRTKLFISIYEAVKHRKEALEAAEALTDTIMSQLLSQIDDATIERVKLVQVASTVLQHFDNAAAIHYQAYNPQ